jgi:hypothetical protein
MTMGAPSSSVRGFWIGRAGFAADGSLSVARVRRDVFCTAANREGRLPDAGSGREACLRAEGARKSRKSGEGVVVAAAAAAAARLYARAVLGVTRGRRGTVLLAVRRHSVHRVEGEAMAVQR